MSAGGELGRLPPGRVSTGTSGLDAMLEGGLVARRPYLVVGPSGTGKTTLALQFLIEGIRRGERVLLVTMDEPPNEMRINHRLLGPELLKVEVFDAIPDIMRYERVPFKDIAAVRQALPFGKVPLEIRRSPELTAVEVTMTGLEQMLRSEVQRRTYSRVVIDSLTALQYFCMKGFDPVAGAQAFLRFLSDLQVTTILTVESPLEDVDTPERMLARGEVRLFRWELEGRTVRAIGVEKFRGSSHDVRLHPYRLGPNGVDVKLDVTISRDTRQITEARRPVEAPPPAAPALRLPEEVITPLDPLAEEVQDLVLVGADVGPLRAEIDGALRAASVGDLALARGRLSRANALVIGLSESLADRMKEPAPSDVKVAEAFQRIVQRSEAARAGMPPTKLPPPKLLEVQLEWVLSLLPGAGPSVPTTAEPASSAPSPSEGPIPTGAEASEGAFAAAPPPRIEEPGALVPEASEPSPPPAVEAVGDAASSPEVSVPGYEPMRAPTGPVTAGPEGDPEPVEPGPSTEFESPPTPEGLGPVEESSAESVEGILAAVGPVPVASAATESGPGALGPVEAAPLPSLPTAPPEEMEGDHPPAAPSEPAPVPPVETLPPALPHDTGVPARPLRAWTPPALPTAAPRTVAPRDVPRREPSPPPMKETRGAAVPEEVPGRRPPLPRSVEDLLSRAERRLPPERIRAAPPVRASVAGAPVHSPAVPTAPSPAPPATGGAPTPAAPATAGPAPAAPVAAKRKRKPRSAPARKKAPPRGTPIAPASSSTPDAARKGEAPFPAEPPTAPSIDNAMARPVAKPKRRPARKRKAPPVVAAHPGPSPSSDEGGAGSSPPPPLPVATPPPPEEPTTSEEKP